MALKTDYKDDVYTGNRKYTMTTNSDSTISLTDVTEYSVTGDTFGATDINETNGSAARDITNLTVATTAWVADTTYTTFPYKADITVATATANDIPDVQPSQTAMDLGMLGGKALASAGIVTIYANGVPSIAITIDRITLRKENS